MQNSPQLAQLSHGCILYKDIIYLLRNMPNKKHVFEDRYNYYKGGIAMLYAKLISVYQLEDEEGNIIKKFNTDICVSIFDENYFKYQRELLESACCSMIDVINDTKEKVK